MKRRNNMSFKNILVPHDFTDFGDLAFEKALMIAKKFNSKLILITVVGSNVDTSGMSLSRAQEALDESEDKAIKELNKKKNLVKDKNIDITVEVIHNPSSVDGIISFAKKNNVDLVAIGSHGRKGFKKLVLGSVASGVATKSNCPVLIVKKQEK